jgi:hypothetical protein
MVDPHVWRRHPEAGAKLSFAVLHSAVFVHVTPGLPQLQHVAAIGGTFPGL